MLFSIVVGNSKIISALDVFIRSPYRQSCVVSFYMCCLKWINLLIFICSRSNFLEI